MMLSELPWHTTILQAELTQLTRRAHAVLWVGPPASGKTRYAQAMAAALLCQCPAFDGRACGQCPSCQWLQADSHPDLHCLVPEVDSTGRVAQDIKIDQVRAMQAVCALHGHRGGRRVVLIDPADALNLAAANALLKTLEEPGEDVFFLLVANRPDVLPATVRSRCQLRVLPMPDFRVAREWLCQEMGCSAPEAQTCLDMAAGAPLRAQSFIEPGRASAYRMMLQVISDLPERSLAEAAEALHSEPIQAWLPLLQRWCLDVGRVRVGAAPRYFAQHSERLSVLAQRTHVAAISAASLALEARVRAIEHPLNPRLVCEHSLLAVFEAFGGAVD